MSIITVAKQAGVSYATVSRVINGRPGVAEETRNKVTQALRETGYVPPPKGRRRGPSIANHRGVQYGTLALLWTCSRPEAMSPVASSLLHGANAAAVKEGLNLVVDCIADTGLLPQIVETGKVDGLMIVGPEPSPELTEKLRRLPCVWLLTRGAEKWGDRVQPDNAAIGHLAFDTLYGRNHRRMACVYDEIPAGTPAYGERATHFVARGEARGVQVSLIQHKCIQHSSPDGDCTEQIDRTLQDIIEQLLEIRQRPTGIFVASDIMVPLHHELIQHGIRPGRDVEIVCCNRENLRAFGVKPSPLVISIQPELIGQLAVDRILWRLENPKYSGAVRVLVYPELLNPTDAPGFDAKPEP